MNGEALQELPDPAKVGLEVEGAAWQVAVMGRAGRASGASAPLLLLGFWAEGDAEDGPPSREVLVVARSIEDLPPESLRAALTMATPPRDPERPPPFFQESGQNRRRRPNENN